MKHQPTLCGCAILVAALAIAHPVSASGTVVYDNTSVATTGDDYAPGGFYKFTYYWYGDEPDPDPTGDEVTLAGSAREVTEFTLMLMSSEATTVPTLTVTFYAPDQYLYPDDSNPLWTGTLSNVSVSGLTAVTFNPDHVVVPDTFIWIVSGPHNDNAGLATMDPPDVGSSGDYYWDMDPKYGWFPLDFHDQGGAQVANFGARVVAAPEPATVLCLAAGALTLLGRRRRRARRP